MPEIVRCPVCTLPIPCNHFSTAAQLMGYKRGRKRIAKALDTSRTTATEEDLLQESHIASRLTDRSVPWTIYRHNCKVIDSMTTKYTLQDTPAPVAPPFAGALIQISRRQKGIQKIAAVNAAVPTDHQPRADARDTGKMSVGVPRSEEHTSELQSLMRISSA